MNMQVMGVGDKIRDARLRIGMSQAELARRAKVSQPVIAELEKGAQKSTKRIALIAKALGVSVAELDNEFEDHAPIASNVPVRGSARAGAWYEFEEFPSDDPELVPIADKRYSALDQFAYLCEGSSMDRAGLPNGTYAICVAYWQARSAATDGDVVVVERRRGQAVERTVKRLKLTRSGIELWPESTDKNFTTPLSVERNGDLKELDGTQVEIIGLVIGAYRAF